MTDLFRRMFPTGNTALALAAIAPPLRARDFATKPVRILAPSFAGGAVAGGNELEANSPASFTSFFDQEIDSWAKAIAATGQKAE